MFAESLLRSKRGVSPLVITIFLAALAVSLGSVIISWGSNQEGRDSSTCNDVSISVQEVLGEELICFNETSGLLKIVVSNSGSAKLDSIVRRKTDLNFNVEDVPLPDSDISPGEVFKTEINMDPGRVRIELIPTINVLNDKVLCTGKSIVRENIAFC